MEEEFNYIIAKPRVSVEHTIGILKAWFCWLRQIRLKITEDKKSMIRLQRYIRVCVILHNLLIGWNDDSFEEDAEDVEKENDGYDFVTTDEPPTGEQRREQLLSYLDNRSVYLTLICKQ